MKLIRVTLCLVILCTGCIPKSYIEELGIITSVGYDSIGEDKMEGTMVLFQFDPTSSTTSQVITTQAKTSKGIRYEANRLTSHRLVSGQVRLEVFQDKLAENGLEKYLDTLSRDAKISDMGYLAVSDIPTKELMSSLQSEDAPNIGIYLQNIIKKSVNSNTIPEAIMTVFVRDIQDFGIDPVLPLFSLKEDKPYIKGLGLFREDKYVGPLNEEDISILMLLKQRSKNTEFQLDIDSESLKDYYKKASGSVNKGTLHVSLNDLSNKTKIHSKGNDFTNQVVKIKIEGRLLEITKEIDLKRPDAIKEIEKQIEKQLETRLQQLLEKLKEMSVDPVGFGKNYNEQHRNHQLTTKEWRSQIPNLNVEFDIQMNLLRYGITE